jgi:uncharacterized protein (DUF1330 family)/quinol monooxygenase YgiN
MQTRRVLLIGAASLVSFVSGLAFTRQPQTPVVRIAELEIHPTQLERYLTIVKEEIETSVRVEPGVLAIHAVAERDSPHRLRFFEIYADEAAYQSHIQSPHFRSYFVSTQSMIASRTLIEATPVQLRAKPNTAVALGDTAPTNLQAQAPATRTQRAFYIAEFAVTDPEALKPYSARVESTLAPFGGRFIKRGGTIAPLEGEPPKGMVVIAFDSMENAQAWYDSPAYREIRPIRHRSARTRAYIVETTGH